MNIKFDNYEKCYPSRLKSFFRAGVGYKNYNEIVQNAKCQTIGDLPPEIIKYFPEEKKESCIKSFLKSLADLSEDLRKYYIKVRYIKCLNFNNYTQKPPEDLIKFNSEITDFFNNILKKFGLGDSIKVVLQFIDFGGFASVYKLSVLNKQGEKICHDKALKIYTNCTAFTQDQKSGHGNYAETNFWTFLKYAAGHDLGKTQYTKHYISDLEHGYALTDFADDKIQKTTCKLDYETLFGIKWKDKKNNPAIYGKYYDVGGYIKINRELADDKMIRRFFKQLMNCNSEKMLSALIKKLKLEAQNPKNEHRNKIKRALELFFATHFSFSSKTKQVN